MSRHRWVWLFVLALIGCGGRLRVEHVASAHAKPSNVWVFFGVDDRGQPVPGLTAGDFDIYEDGVLVEPAASKQVVQDPDAVSVGHTLLLVDVSGSAVRSGHADLLAAAASAFSARISRTQKVGVYAFDGSEKLQPIVPFGGTLDGLHALETIEPRDASTNLRGAIVEALGELSRSLAREARPLKLGTLVVFANGPDRASRIEQEAMMDSLEAEPYRHYQVHAIGLGEEAKKADLSAIGRDGQEVVGAADGLAGAFDRAATRVEGQRQRLYLLSYCTPARGGEHELKIKVRTQGPEPSTGSVRTRFVADGFGTPPECDPMAPPSFTAQAAPTKAEEEAAEPNEKERGKAPKSAPTRANPKVIDYKPKTPD